MKTFAILMIVLSLALMGVMGYALFNTALQVEGKALQVIPAADRAADFAALQTQIERESVDGTLFDKGPLLDASGYQFYVYTLRLKNNCLVPAEMVEVQLAPMQGDVLCYDEDAEVIISPGESGDVWCVLLTNGQSGSVRELTVTYYLWGHPQTVKYTYEP